MRRASMAEMVRNVLSFTKYRTMTLQDSDSQQAIQDLRESIQLDDVIASPVEDDETVKSTATTTEPKDEAKGEDEINGIKDPEVKPNIENQITIKSTDTTLRDRPKSVLKNKDPTPVITTSTLPNTDLSNPHRDRECCNIS